MHWKRHIEVLTPLFNRGAYQDTPELRVPSIRGMVRWWFRVLGGTPDEEKEAFGGMPRLGQRLRGQVNASSLVFRVGQVRVRRATPNPATLPHDPRKPSPQAAFAPGATFQLEVFTRFGDLAPELEIKVQNALEVWLLLGALGLRANRSGGNVWPADGSVPQSSAELRQRLNACGCRWPVMLAAKEVGSNVEQLRAAATDTVDGMPSVFGRVRGGRIASKVKFKVVKLDGVLRLAVTAPDEGTLNTARDALLRKPQPARSKPQTWVAI
jgi:hypothetical protein